LGRQEKKLADDKTEKVKKLMTQPEKIRNIAIAAHIDHGKCIAGNSRLVLDGGVKNAKELFELSERKGKKAFEDENKEIYDISDLGINTFSLDRNEKRLKKKKISHAWRLKGGDVIKLKLRNGFEIKTTPEHKYIVFEDFEFKEREARELKIGERVVCPRMIDIQGNIDMEKYLLESLEKDNFYVVLRNEFGRELKDRIMSEGMEKIYEKLKLEIKKKSFYHGVWKNRYFIKDILKIAENFDIDKKILYYGIKNISYRSGKWRGKSSLEIGLPKNFRDFFYIAGLMFGDGHEKKFIVGKPELELIFKKICKALGVEISYRDYGNRTKEIVTSETFSRMLNCVFGYPLKKKSHNIKVSELLWKADRNFVGEFLSGYFDTDGCVEKTRRAVSISSASRRMMEDLSLLLLRFGCIPVISDKGIYISGNSAREFAKKIGFRLKDKSLKLNDLIKVSVGSRVSDMISVSSAGVGEVILASGKSFLALEKEKQIQLSSLLEQFAFIEVNSIERGFEETVYDFSVPETKNFVAEGMIVHNTTFSDNLLAGAGMMSQDLAGKARVLDFHEDEIARGITIDAASVSMVHTTDGEDYLINLIDTPGHVDFGGDVTRAMRAVDGCIVLVCASEGIMPQTETVLRQALRERVKPVLFINKVDRLIKEVKLTPEEMQKRFIAVIAKVNELIESIAEPEFKQKFKVNVQEGSVAFGSAYHNWALSVPYMQKKGITFKEIIDSYNAGEEEYKKLSKRAPLHEVVLNMVNRHHPNPVVAQKYRIPKIWHGDENTKVGQDLITCNPEGEPAFVCTKIVVDKNAGEIAAGRLFSGTLKPGDSVYMNLAKRRLNLQQVSIYKGAQRIQVDKVVAGNIVGLVGLKGAFAGETVSGNEIEPFEAIKHIFEPVVTKSIEATKAADLPKLVEVLRQVNKEDPSIQIEINEETGENLISGMGELHLEIIENRIKTEKGLDVKTGPPIVVYRESVNKQSSVIEARTPNGHNIFQFSIEPLEDAVYEKIVSEEIPEGRLKKKAEEIWKKLEEAGMSSDEARQVRDIYKGNIFEDRTRGIVLLGEIIDSIMDGWKLVIDAGPLAREPLMKTKFIIHDTKIHVDHMHRGPAQIYPAVRKGMHETMKDAKPVILEPIQTHLVEAPVSFMGAVTALISTKRGILEDVQQEGETISIKAKIPVSEMIGWSNDLRSRTEGRGVSSLVDQTYQKLPSEMQENVIKKIRERKGLAENQ